MSLRVCVVITLRAFLSDLTGIPLFLFRMHWSGRAKIDLYSVSLFLVTRCEIDLSGNVLSHNRSTKIQIAFSGPSEILVPV